MARLTLHNLRKMRSENEPITAATAFDYAGIKLVEEGEIDVIVLSDWVLSTVLLGNPTAAQATMDHISFYVRALARLVERGFIVAPMPFGTYQVSDEDAIANATQLIKAGADSVKLEGGATTIERVRALSAAGIPCVGHLGFTPQRVKQLGEDRVIGDTAEEAAEIYRNALALEESGAWGVVLQNVPDRVASTIREFTNLITIGTGGTKGCDGHLVVTHDLLGWPMGAKPRFSVQNADFAQRAVAALNRHVAEVKALEFPGPEHTFNISDDEFDAFIREIGEG